VCGFNDWRLAMLAEYGCRETVLIQVESRSNRKTDHRDAHALAELLWINRERRATANACPGCVASNFLRPGKPRNDN
jgi:hypothetical protein